jgi:hypothetical protein
VHIKLITILAVMEISLLFGARYATAGSIDSTVEINDSTANGPVLSAVDHFGTSVTNRGR